MIWGILLIVLASVIYNYSNKITPHPQDRFGLTAHFIELDADVTKKIFHYSVNYLPFLLWIVAIIIGFSESLLLGFSFMGMSIVLWVWLSPSKR